MRRGHDCLLLCGIQPHRWVVGRFSDLQNVGQDEWSIFSLKDQTCRCLGWREPFPRSGGAKDCPYPGLSGNVLRGTSQVCVVWSEMVGRWSHRFESSSWKQCTDRACARFCHAVHAHISTAHGINFRHLGIGIDIRRIFAEVASHLRLWMGCFS